MFDTIDDILFPHALHCLVNHALMVILDLTSQLPCAERLKFLLHFAEDQFDRIVLGTVSSIIYVAKAKLPHQFLCLFRGVHRELVHEQSDLIITGDVPEARQPLFELSHVHRFRIDLVVLDSFFLGDPCE